MRLDARPRGVSLRGVGSMLLYPEVITLAI
jgi:hypothetical protein